MTRLKIKNKEYKIIDSYSIKSSNNQVTFNNIKIDFSEGTQEDIPYKYQKVQVIQDGNVIFTGYLDTITFGKLKTNNPYKEITLTLLSPLKLATRRCIDLIGTYDLSTAITRILQPLIDDGFTIAELNVPEGQITTSFVLETIENAMNNIGSKRNIFWTIDEKQNIYVNSIDYLFGQNVKMEITEEKMDGLLELQPTISNIDYANIINFKNIRLVYSTTRDNFEYQIVSRNKVVKQGDIVNFDYPIILDEAWLRNKMSEYSNIDNSDFRALNLSFSGGYEMSYGISMWQDSPYYNVFRLSGNLSVTFSDSSGNEGDIVLQRDQFFKELITGFKWNKSTTVTLNSSASDIALRYTTMRFLHSGEIEKLKGIISDSGQIEKTIDYEEKWITIQQLIAYARSLIVQNSNIINEVKLVFDKNPNVVVGDIITINRPNYYIQGKFAIKDIDYSNNRGVEKWTIIAKTSDFISSYMDLFRPAEQQQPENSINTVILSEFSEEQFVETHNVTDYEDDEAKAIRLSKDAWDEEMGSGSDYLTFTIQGHGQTDADYIVQVADPQTSQTIGYVYVNVDSEECEVELQ